MNHGIRIVVRAGVLAGCLSVAWAQAPAPEKPEPSQDESPASAADLLADQLKKHAVDPVNKPGALPLYMLDTQSGQLTRIAGEVVPGLIYCGAVDWSHDGKRIVVDVGEVANGRDWRQTQLISIEAGKDRPLYRKLGSGCLPSIAADGDKIVFMMFPGMADAVDSSFWVMNVDGSERRKLEDGGRPKAAPGGRLCLICSMGKPSQYRVVNLATGVAHVINLPDRQFFSIPSWADETTFVAMTGVTRGDFISLIDVSDPEEARIKEDLWKRGEDQDFKPRSPIFTPETGICAFIGREKGRMNTIYWRKKGDDGPLKHFEAVTGEDLEGVAKSPGGRYIVFSTDSRLKPKE